MDLSLTPEQEMLKNSAREFLEKEVPRTTVMEITDSESGFSAEIWRKMAELGWVGLCLPEQYGGMGTDLLTMGVLLEELGYAAFPTPIHSTVFSGLVIDALGSEAQKRQYLPGIASGERIFTVAFTEPHYGWSPDVIQLQATPRNGRFVLNGTKLFVPDAQVADHLVVLARTQQSEDPAAGITAFVVDRNSPGVHVEGLGGFTGVKLNEVTFTNVEVPNANVLGEPNQAWAGLEPVLDKATVLACAFMVGGMQSVYEITNNYVRTRIQFGVPIGTFQRVQDFVIDLVNHLDASRWTTYEAIWKIDADKEGKAESVSVAKAVSSEGYLEACNDAHRAHGGIGISKRYGLYLYTQLSRGYYDYLGSPRYHKLRLARLLGL